MGGVPVFHDPLVLRHETGPHHPESARRVQACVEALRKAGFAVEAPESPERTRAAIERVHDPGYVQRLAGICSAAPEAAGTRPFALFDSPDNPLSAATYDAAVRAVGLTLAASDRVVAGKERAVFVAVRPPGHHALEAEAMGFCFFNTVAVVARDLIQHHGLSRVLVADFDVHHGNGTQDLFWEDGQVAYLSVHRYPFYPGTGASDEEGEGRGRGTTLNVPQPEGAGDLSYVVAFTQALERLASRFRPEIVLVSAGFDAHVRDPLGGMRVTSQGFKSMTERLREVAEAFASGRVVSLLEGGYDTVALGEAAVIHASELAGSP
ncbi:MAG TPA: histone deacetylase [Thermoanaerobaculia bacterium]|nr:histone deacetylase [Thermoanaerobaculia bacterium]